MATMATTRTTARARRDGERATTTARRWDAAVRVAGATDARAIARANGVAVGRARAARGRMDEIDAIDRAARRGGRAVDRGRREDGRGGAGDRESPRRERGGGCASGRGDAGDASRERWTDARAHFFMFSQAPSKKPAPAPAAIKAKQPKKEPKGPTNPLFERRPKNFGIGNSLPVKTPLNRYVKWPKYVRIQRQRRVLQKRLKVPPAVNQFNNTLDKNLATNLFKLLMKYRPEDAAQKKERLAGMAQAEAAGADVESKKPVVVKFGINHITYLIEQGKAQLVVIAHDVDPVELVVWLPALCKQMNVPYCIVKGKARLGAVVHKKTATALALTAIKNEDKLEFSKLVEAIKASYNDVFQKTSRTWGGGIMGVKSQAKTAARERIIARELAQRATVKI